MGHDNISFVVLATTPRRIEKHKRASRDAMLWWSQEKNTEEQQKERTRGREKERKGEKKRRGKERRAEKREKGREKERKKGLCVIPCRLPPADPSLTLLASRRLASWATACCL